MNNIAIKVENLGKRYHIREKIPYKALRDVLGNLIAAPFRIRKGASKKSFFSGYIWALNDVSFEIKQGEAVGIIGRNGAGKTTLLKILSRITYPTKGRAEIRGWVGSLLDVGTGFHPELTGRENIYLNGAILGMKKKDMDKQFDEIVSFAEVEKFIDTPVKHFSSGMYMRLAFAVAAYMEPEILLVDEVLAVGDIGFQKKCLGKMDDVTREGRTVLFVSHNLQAINQLCPRTVLLNDGMILKDGATQDVLHTYLAMSSNLSNLNGDLSDPRLRLPTSNPDSLFKWTRINIINSEKQITSDIRFNESFEILFRGRAAKKCGGVMVGLAVSSKMTGYIFATQQVFNGLEDILDQGESEFRLEMNPNLLAPGRYEIEISAVGPAVKDWIRVAMEFNILELGITPDKSWHHPHQAGVLDYPCKWSVRNIEDGK